MKQYKKYKKPSDKVKGARILLNLIKSGIINVRTIGCLAQWYKIERIGQDILNKLPTSLGKLNKSTNRFEFNSQRLPINRAKVYVWYCLVLAMMPVPLGSYTAFVLDTFPGDEPDKGKTPGLGFMKLISTNTIFEEYWRKFMKTPYFFSSAFARSFFNLAALSNNFLNPTAFIKFWHSSTASG